MLKGFIFVILKNIMLKLKNSFSLVFFTGVYAWDLKFKKLVGIKRYPENFIEYVLKTAIKLQSNTQDRRNLRLNNWGHSWGSNNAN